MRTDNQRIAVLVAFALHPERAFSLRHPSFEAEGIPLMLSWGGAFERQREKRSEQVFSLSHTCGCRAACSNCQTCHHQSVFFISLTMKWLDDIKRREEGGSWVSELELKASSSFRGPFPDQRGSSGSRITEQLGGMLDREYCPGK